MNPENDPAPPRSETPPELGGLDAGELLARGLHTVEGSGSVRRWLPPTPEELARLLPQFRIVRLLGHGGMGAVYQGEQSALDRKVAIKLLPAEMAGDENFVARFQREAKLLAKLQHPGIVAVYDFGQTSAGHPYFVMEYVDGTDLQRVLREPGLKPLEAYTIIGQICEALHYAHQQGVIHRDIKPANILLTRDGRAKVADFGLARPQQRGEDDLTQAAMVMGTPAYMAPEQREGNADHRADIYALGVMLYEMLTGERPNGAFDPPSQMVQVDVRIDRVVLKALQARPDRRYQHVSEMREEVEDIRTSRMQANPKFRSRGPTRGWAIAVGSVAVVALLLAGGWFVVRSRKPGFETPKATGEHRDAARLANDASPGIVASREKPFVNSLGMEFVPVPDTDVLFCTTVTRVQDFRVFVNETGYIGANNTMRISWKGGLEHGGSWQDPGFSQGEDYPLVCVNHDDAKAFCDWLSHRDHRTFRLPTDHEWSCAAGLGKEDKIDFSKPERPMAQQYPQYPWGAAWPPPPNAVNFADETLAELRPELSLAGGFLHGYRDGYAGTAPARHYIPNPSGLFNMAGNVSQICEERMGAPDPVRGQDWVSRGGNFSDDSGRIRAGYRRGSGSGQRLPYFGFRCVLERSTTEPATRRAPEAKIAVAKPTEAVTPSPKAVVQEATRPSIEARKEKPFVNSLGMEFVPVPDTDVLFCTTVTRVQDFRVFVNETGYIGANNTAKANQTMTGMEHGGSWEDPGFPQGEDYPVVCVNIDDGRAFCQWLSAREQRAYRLPKDHEWSCAAGIGNEKKLDLLHGEKSNLGFHYPWGTAWPPPPNAGNFADETLAERLVGVTTHMEILRGYRDGYVGTAPARHFDPNPFGLFNMAGNVTQICDDLLGPLDPVRGQDWVSRGGNFTDGGGRLGASYRRGSGHGNREPWNGFRCVLERTPTTLAAPHALTPDGPVATPPAR